mgnify:CR=1 FL=1
MKYLTKKEFEKEMAQIQWKKRQYEMKKELREAKRRFPKLKKPRTSKMVLWTVIILCAQILWFTEHMATITGDTSFMYALVAIPASLIPTVLSYMKNSRMEHQMGQFESPIETPSENCSDNEDENNAAG